MDVLRAPSSFASSPHQMERSIQGFLLHCQPGDTPQQEIWGMSSTTFSLILRTLCRQYFAVSHVPTVAQRPLCFQNWGKFSFPYSELRKIKFSLFLPSTNNPEAQRTQLEANLTWALAAASSLLDLPGFILFTQQPLNHLGFKQETHQQPDTLFLPGPQHMSPEPRFLMNQHFLTTNLLH